MSSEGLSRSSSGFVENISYIFTELEWNNYQNFVNVHRFRSEGIAKGFER